MSLRREIINKFFCAGAGLYFGLGMISNIHEISNKGISMQNRINQTFNGSVNGVMTLCSYAGLLHRNREEDRDEPSVD